MEINGYLQEEKLLVPIEKETGWFLSARLNILEERYISCPIRNQTKIS
jgi:hypothetical protein